MVKNMHEIDLTKFNIHTDLIIESNLANEVIKKQISKDISIEKSVYNNDTYITIKFNDVTDKDNYKLVSNVFIEEIKKVLPVLKNKTILIVGLGNELSTPDSLGPKVIDNILVTKHLFDLGEVEEGYEKVAAIKPQVTAQTGIETKDLISGVIKTISADVLIVIDALASSSIDRVNKTIQITTAGIHPGSGVGNDRKELSKNTLKIPVISIGVPTIVDYTTIVADTLKYLVKKVSFTKENIDNNKLKLVSVKNQNYLKCNKELSEEEKSKVLGLIGTLTDQETKDLINEVLIPINYNLMVTPKDIDYIIEKLANLIGQGLNKAIHENYNRQN